VRRLFSPHVETCPGKDQRHTAKCSTCQRHEDRTLTRRIANSTTL
jgi:hypothetical protein